MTQVAINIPDDLQPFIEQSVKAGLFNDASDFMVNLLYRIKTEREIVLSEMENVRLAALRAQIAAGTGEADRGEFVEFTAEDIIEEGRRTHAAAA